VFTEITHFLQRFSHHLGVVLEFFLLKVVQLLEWINVIGIIIACVRRFIFTISIVTISVISIGVVTIAWQLATPAVTSYVAGLDITSLAAAGLDKTPC
jgi:hypothetical protein